MVRWLRIAALGALVISLMALGIGIGLFLVANAGWVLVSVPPWLTSLFGDSDVEFWLPSLIAGWLISILTLMALVIWSMFYVWRRQQYESLIDNLERELAELRNLPFTAPAPLEDLSEDPDSEAAEILAFGEKAAAGRLGGGFHL